MVKFVVKLKHGQIGTKIGVVVDIYLHLEGGPKDLKPSAGSRTRGS